MLGIERLMLSKSDHVINLLSNLTAIVLVQYHRMKIRASGLSPILPRQEAGAPRSSSQITHPIRTNPRRRGTITVAPIPHDSIHFNHEIAATQPPPRLFSQRNCATPAYFLLRPHSLTSHLAQRDVSPGSHLQYRAKHPGFHKKIAHHQPRRALS